MAKVKSTLSGRIVRIAGLFMGVQAVIFICTIVRTKMVAWWIGPAGVGLFAIYFGALNTIATFGQLGLHQSAVKELSQASDNPQRRALLVLTVRRWGVWLGVLSMAVTAVLAPALSRWFFGDSAHVLAFLALSVAVFCLVANNGERAVLQGSGQFGRLAKASLFGSATALLISAPLFYFFRLESIVPSLIAYAAATFAGYMIYRDRTVLPAVVADRRRIFAEGKPMIKLGLYLTAATGITTLFGLIFNVWLNREASTAQVGVFQSGYTVVMTYLGALLTAVAMEFYPRLSAVAGNKTATRVYLNHQTGILLLLFLPVVLWMTVLAPVVVTLLYSSAFAAAVPFVVTGMAVYLLRPISYCYSYVILARGDGRMYVLSEVVADGTGLVFNIVGYRMFGIYGLGLAFAAWQMVSIAIVYAIIRYRYRISLSRRIILLTGLSVVVTCVCAAAAVIYPDSRLVKGIISVIAVVGTIICGTRLFKLTKNKRR